ncbi:MAG TPA: phosphoglycerate dehydrogenase, partial [Albitalea sp.]
MDLLIVEPLEDEVAHWLASRHTVRLAPELALDAHALRHALYDVRALVIPPSVALDARALHDAPMLKAVGCVGARADQVDVEACARAGVEVVCCPAASAQAEAEFMIGALLSMLRRAPVVGGDGRRMGRELGGSTVGLVGMAPAARA